jgi:polyvinyl alcohol dehydrogenase (cytochrome)
VRSSALFLAATTLVCAQAPDGQAIYTERCATCHQNPVNDRIPSRAALAALTPDQVAAALERGPMTAQAQGMTAAQIRAVAAFVGTASAPAAAAALPGQCGADVKPFAPGPNDWSGWGVDMNNSRYQPNPGLSAADVPRLKLKWAFGFPGDTRAVAQPAIVGGRVFVGSHGGFVYSLDLETGCTHWRYEAGSIARTGIEVVQVANRWMVYFGDSAAYAHALDAVTGREIWKVKLDDYPVARITGTPTFYDGRLYVPVSSGEELASGGANYVCCKFRGSMVALDGLTGRIEWKTYTIPDPARVYKTTEQGRELWGPAGAAMWSSPLVDLKRRRVYSGTGNSYTGVEIPTSDAVVAFDLDTGSLLWSNQLTPKDNWLPGCPRSPLCPEEAGDDYDFASTAVMVTAGGRDLILIGQKSGVLYALDPDDMGRKVWETRLGQGGGLMGGIMWGLATDGQTAYVGVADPNRPDGTPGVYAVRVSDGQVVWASKAPPGERNPASPTAVSLIPGVVFSATMGGHFRAHDARTGEIIWDQDVNRAIPTVNGVEAKGGSFDGAGPAIANGMVVVASGMGFAGGTAGNILLAYSVDGQ